MKGKRGKDKVKNGNLGIEELGDLGMKKEGERGKKEIRGRKSEVGDKKAQSSGLKDRRRVLEGYNAIKLGRVKDRR